MSGKRQRLELTWIGKDERPKLEPRILLEDVDKSYARKYSNTDLFDNRLIRADNLLALKALEGEFAGKIKCIYIDPPFNTQQALQNYDDGVEHSLWLSIMRDRLEVLHRLLTDDGTLFIHIDDNEVAYLTVLADQIFGRVNRRYIITFKQASATGHKSINPGCVSTTNYILIYAKNSDVWKPNRVYTDRDRDQRYNQFILNRDEPFSNWSFCTLVEGYARQKGLDVKTARKRLKESPEQLDDFVIQEASSVIQWARPSYDSVSKETRTVIDRSEDEPRRIFRIERDGYSDIYLRNGQRILFYSEKLKSIDGQLVAGEPLTTLWDDILSNNIHKEGGVDFPKGKKPEALLKRCIELATAKGDWVLDSFAGSGTTGAVAHKMGRRWMLVEMGTQADSHIVPRLTRVINGEDLEGISKSSAWKGGGGFRYFHLAPSLLEKDRWGNWVIARSYNAAMLAEAMCKHMGFTYAPSQDPAEYWRHGHSSERDFIFVTTANVTHDQLRAISEDVGSERTLLVCCKAFNARANAFENLTVKKIPQAVLSRCEWGRDDYSLRIAEAPPQPEDTPPLANSAAAPSKRGRRAAAAIREPSLFSALDAKGAGK